MVDLDQIVELLHAKRRELLAELETVDKAIAALEHTQPADLDVGQRNDVPPLTSEAPASTDSPVTPTVVKPKRVLTDSHRQALLEGRRRARAVKDTAAGHAREMPDASFVPALAPKSGSQPPRLVKK